MKTFVDYIRNDTSMLRSRVLLMGMFSYMPDRPIYPEKPELEGGIVFAKKPSSIANSKYGYYEGDTFHEIVPSKFGKGEPFCQADPIKVTSKDIKNLKKDSIDSIIGSFVANQVLLVEAFDDVIPYVNDGWNIYKIERNIGSLVLNGTISTEQHLKYVELGYALSHFGELFVPTMSEKTTSVPKYILKKRDELLLKHKDELKDPIIVAAIEKELIDMYIEYVGDDEAGGFMEAGSKSYSSHAKTMHIMVGGVSDFGGTVGEVVVIPKSLNEGWDKNEFPAMANSIRKGSHGRGVGTQQGGALTKLIFRAFQDVELKPGDCGSTRFIPITFDKIVTPSMFIGRTIISNSKKSIITDVNANSFIGKTVKMRSPVYCKLKDGICITCMGKIFEQLEITHPGTLAITVTSAMMDASMAEMHVDAIEVLPIDFDNVLV